MVSKPRFNSIEKYESLILDVNNKKVRLDENNPGHRNLVKYVQKRDAFSEEYAEWCRENGKEESNGFKEYYEVTVAFAGEKTVMVFADSEEDAEEQAISQLDFLIQENVEDVRVRLA